MANETAHAKLGALEALLQSWGTVAVGYSGGVDSTFLAAVCTRALPEGAVLMRLDTPFAGTPERASVARATSGQLEACRPGGNGGESAVRERDAAQACGAERAAGVPRVHGATQAGSVSQDQGARAFGLPLVTVPMDPFAHDEIVCNGEDRCYHCKRAGFAALVREAQERGIAVVVDGSNADDADDYRPGMRALRELGVRSPLMETGWRKEEERELLRAWGIPVWNMPAGACLATRIPCGEPLTSQKLDTVRACEDYLHEMGLQQVRARLVGGRVRVEAEPGDLQKLTGREHGVADMAAAATAEVALPAAVRQELERRAGCTVEPFARPYGKGNMNSR